jgi:tetratricopeptide (TPR) repeat protein
VAFNPADGTLAIAKTRSLVQLVDAASGSELATLEAPDPKNVSALDFSPDGRLLVVARDAAGIQIWDLAAIGRGLEPLGLHWAPAASAGAIDSPLFVPKRIVVENPRWMVPLVRGEEHARSRRWDDAAKAFEEAIASGARHVAAQKRWVLLRRARGDAAAYGEACRQLLQMGDASELVPLAAHEIAWACALGARAVADYDRVVKLAELAAASDPGSSRLNTLGAVLYRAGRVEEAVHQLMRAAELRGAGEDSPYDALFLAMAHHQLGHTHDARRWLQLGTRVDPVATRRPAGPGDASWIRDLELEILGREASAMIESIHPAAE